MFAKHLASAVFVSLLLTGTAGAAEIALLSAAAMQTVFNATARDFETASGHKLIITYDTIGGIDKRVRAGESYDVIVGSSLIMPALANEGRLDPKSLVTICRTAIGGVVPTGAQKPAFVTVDDFKQALLMAKFIIYADPTRGGAAGVHIGKQIEWLGLADALKAKTRVAAGGDVTEVTMKLGQGALGMTQVSEIVNKTGADFIGYLPDELQNYTVFVAGVPVDGQASGPAASYLNFLRSPRTVEMIAARGMLVERGGN